MKIQVLSPNSGSFEWYGIAPHDFCEAPQVILIQCFCNLGTAAK